MRSLFLSILLFVPFILKGNYPSSNTRIVQLHKEESVQEISVLVNSKKTVQPKRDRVYHWYSFDQVQVNEGAFSGQLLHGIYRLYDLSGRLVEQGRFDMGLKAGLWYKWDKDGKINQETEWKNSRKNGKSTSYHNGRLVREESYRNGLLHGNSILYDLNGNKEVYKFSKGAPVIKAKKEKDENRSRIFLFKRLLKLKKIDVLESDVNAGDMEFEHASNPE